MSQGSPHAAHPTPRPDAARPPTVAGKFYPAEPELLRQTIRRLLAEARPRIADWGPAVGRPKALIVPHAAYACSGPVAAVAYALLAASSGQVQQVVLTGPAHGADFQGLATTSHSAFLTPLGPIALDRTSAGKLQASLPFVCTDSEAHAPEHSLEVQLPFLQCVLPHFRLVPVLWGVCSSTQIAAALEQLWNGPETLVIVSSDLSHYQSYAVARHMDRATAEAIERLAPDQIAPDQACGQLGIQGLLRVAAARGLTPRTLDLRNSGDTVGRRPWVVGYGAFAFLKTGG